MQIQYIGYRVRGFYRLADYAVRWGMVNEIAVYRYKVLCFWEKYGIEAIMEAFSVKRRSLYRWKKKLREHGGDVGALALASSAPKSRRKRAWPKAVTDEIRRLRSIHPNLGKEKIYPLLASFCQHRRCVCPGVSTIGRIIADAPDKMRHAPQRLSSRGKPKPVRSKRKARKPKGFVAQWPGHLIALDTVERIRDGCRRYILTMVDIHSRMALAVGTTSHASRAAKDFLSIIRHVFPEPVHAVLSDNGREFQGEFAKALEQTATIHWHTYPRTPKMNAHNERFNRTIQEEFVDYYEDMLFSDPLAFNEQLAEWLLWYNCERPHYSHGQISPLQFLVQNKPECQTYWTHTLSCKFNEFCYSAAVIHYLFLFILLSGEALKMRWTWLFTGLFLFASAAIAAPKTAPQAPAEDEVPDAMHHMVKAPYIDFANLRDPFQSYLTLVAARGRAALLDREHRLSNREREVLEGFDLVSLKLVAIFSMGEDRVAMIEDATGKGYMVRRGNYMGKNNGHVEKIDTDTLFLVEQVLNPAGDITDRQVTLTLKEVNE